MTIGLTPDEDLEQYDDLDAFDDAGFDLRGGGTDLFRAMLVLLIAAAVGALILTRALPDATTAGEAAAGDESIESTDADAIADDAASTDDPAAPETDAATDTSADAMAGQEAGTMDDSSADGSADGAATDPNATTDGTTTDPNAADSTAADSDDTDLTMSDGSVARDPAEVEVLVLNATDVKGIAAKASELLQIASYNTAPAGNATNAGIGSVILYKEGYRADAVAVAQVFTDGLEGLVQAFDPASPPSNEIGTANVIVVLGVDEAIPIG